MKKIIIGLVIVLFVLFFIPVKSKEFIKYSNPMDDGGPLYNAYFNVFNIKIYEKIKIMKGK